MAYDENHPTMRIQQPYPESPLVIWHYAYTPAAPNPPEAAETYAPVSLTWQTAPMAPTWQGSSLIALGKRGNRVYTLTNHDNGRAYGIAVNSVHIPVIFPSPEDARLFAQHIEDTNTED